jgi:hypothetical protein
MEDNFLWDSDPDHVKSADDDDKSSEGEKL